MSSYLRIELGSVESVSTPSLQFGAFKIVANLDFLVFLHELVYSATFDTIY